MNSDAQLADAEASLQRIHRMTYVVIAVAIVAGFVLAGWQMAAGMALGGALSLFNERWLRASIGAIFGTVTQTQTGTVPRWTLSKFLLRYAVIAVVTGLALWSRKIDLIGFAIGFASFVLAVMIEAAYQGYLTFKLKS
jgi:hypothetical protein